MGVEYFAWLGLGTLPDSVIIVNEHDETFVFDIRKQVFERDDYFLKAKYDPGSDYKQITKEKAAEILAAITKDK